MDDSPARDIIPATHGRWPEILRSFGLSPIFLSGKNCPCPLCGGKDRARFTDRQGDGDYICGQCGAGKGVKLLMRLHGWSFREAADEVATIIGKLPAAPERSRQQTRKAAASELNQLWSAGLKVSADDPVGEYLIGRGIDLEEVDTTSLRFLPGLPHYPTGTEHAGMIAILSDATGKAVQLHRTYLTNDGRKADVVPVRMFMPGELPKGGAIRLGPPGARMGVAEGIETALSATQLFGWPVWATTAANMLEVWQPPPEATRITIFADSDANYVGQAAAYLLARRLIFEAARDKVSREVEVLLPSRGCDWNDVLNKKTPALGPLLGNQERAAPGVSRAGPEGTPGGSRNDLDRNVVPTQ